MAKPNEEEVEKMSKLWDLAVVMFVVSIIPNVDSLNRSIALAWKDINKPIVLYHEEGYFIVRFKTKDDFNVVMNSPPLAMGVRPIIIKKWVRKFDF